MNDLKLLVDCCLNGSLMLDLNESANAGLTKFKGIFQRADEVNKNKRLYPFAILDENVRKLNDLIKSSGLIGELDHPTDSILHFERASHKITKLWWEGKELWGQGEILTTPFGRILKSLLNDGVKVGVSSRGVGNGRTDENGTLVIGDSYRLLTFDCVADPSVGTAFQEKVVGKESYYPQYSSPKNESKCIDKKVLIACLGGVVKDKTKLLMESLMS